MRKREMLEDTINKTIEILEDSYRENYDIQDEKFMIEIKEAINCLKKSLELLSNL